MSEIVNFSGTIPFPKPFEVLAEFHTILDGKAPSRSKTKNIKTMFTMESIGDCIVGQMSGYVDWP